jgi:CubicO group peptidase (beta-lactamase class C family)
MTKLSRFVLVMALTLIAIPVQAGSSLQAAAIQESTPATGEGVYNDPVGRFTIPVPSTWSVVERDGFIDLVDPDDDIHVAVVVTTAEGAHAGIAAAWEVIDPAFDQTPVPMGDQTVPSAEGIDETVVITYDGGQTSGRVSQAFAQRVGDQVYVMIFDGTVEAATRRNAQIGVIATGLVPMGRETTDLSGVAPAAFTGELIDEFEAYAQALLDRLEVPGAALAVVQDGQVVYANGLGVKEQDGSDPVSADTLMMIGSTSKSFTTLLMATLVDEGVIDWDTPVVDVLPNFQFANPELTQEITLEHLVCACTGVPRRDIELMFNANDLTAEEVIATLATFEVFTDFGETFQYSNQMVATGGYAAASAAGGIYGDLDDAYTVALQERVLGPLGMERTTLSFITAASDGDVAMPHGATLQGTYEPIPLETEALLEPVKPAGTLWSSANEMGQYLIMQLQNGVTVDGERIVSGENLLRTREPQVEITASIDYGLGWLIEEYKGTTIVQHGGNTMGFTLDFALLPEFGIGMAILANGQGANLFTEAVRYRLLELVFGLPAEIQESIDFAIEQTAIAVEDLEGQIGERPAYDDVSEYLGRYTSAALGEIELRWSDEEGLTLDAGEFSGELRPIIDPDQPGTRIGLIDGPMAGLPFEFGTDSDGWTQLTVDLPPDRYVFELVEPAKMLEGTATPAASEIGNPEAA